MATLIRPAKEGDAAEIARLASQLGYPANEAQLLPRLRRLLANSNDLVLVAEAAESGLAGWIHGFRSQLLESDFRVEIGGLIVDDQSQRRGIGRELVRHIEVWARESGAAQISVRCRTCRTGSHHFYERLEFCATKTQIVFRKQLR